MFTLDQAPTVSFFFVKTVGPRNTAQKYPPLVGTVIEGGDVISPATSTLYMNDIVDPEMTAPVIPDQPVCDSSDVPTPEHIAMSPACVFAGQTIGVVVDIIVVIPTNNG